MSARYRRWHMRAEPPPQLQPAVAAAATPRTSDIGQLLIQVPPIAPSMVVDRAAELFLQPEYSRLLCLPVVDAGGRPLGTISRHTLNGIFLRRFGREIFGARPVEKVMNALPMLVDLSAPLEDTARDIGARIGSPISEDFLIVQDGRYRGVGIVLDLIAALQKRVDEGSRQLSAAFDQLKASQAQLVQSEKMASLGQMVAGVAHEINTPLGYVRNNVEMVQGVFEQVVAVVDGHEKLLLMLADETADEAQLSQRLAACGSQLESLRESNVVEDTRALFGDTLFGADTIKELVVSLRNFSRLDQAQSADASVNDLLDQSLTIANNVLKNKVQVIKRYGEVPRIRCSPSQINQVLLNMMTNAAQAIEHADGKLLLKTEVTNGWVRIHVGDNGKGIAPEHLGRVFDPFFTTKPVGHGTGLGLSISFQIVQQHGGRIDVASRVGHGTKFVISLPAAASPAPAITS